MKKVWDRLPGPTPVKVAEAVLLVIVALVLLVILFEWAGRFLDSGGAIG